MSEQKTAYDTMIKGYRFVATYVSAGSADIVISKDGNVLKSFTIPAYKIWNIAAHADDIIADIEDGLAIALSTGLGGQVGIITHDLSEAIDE